MTNMVDKRIIKSIYDDIEDMKWNTYIYKDSCKFTINVAKDELLDKIYNLNNNLSLEVILLEPPVYEIYEEYKLDSSKNITEYYKDKKTIYKYFCKYLLELYNKKLYIPEEYFDQILNTSMIIDDKFYCMPLYTNSLDIKFLVFYKYYMIHNEKIPNEITEYQDMLKYIINK